MLKPKKPSRNQKRAIKKKELQEELEQERKEIGDWVRLERRDLIQGLERIEEKEKKMREKVKAEEMRATTLKKT